MNRIFPPVVSDQAQFIQGGGVITSLTLANKVIRTEKPVVPDPFEMGQIPDLVPDPIDIFTQVPLVSQLMVVEVVSRVSSSRAPARSG